MSGDTQSPRPLFEPCSLLNETGVTPTFLRIIFRRADIVGNSRYVQVIDDDCRVVFFETYVYYSEAERQVPDNFENVTLSLGDQALFAVEIGDAQLVSGIFSDVREVIEALPTFSALQARFPLFVAELANIAKDRNLECHCFEAALAAEAASPWNDFEAIVELFLSRDIEDRFVYFFRALEGIHYGKSARIITILVNSDTRSLPGDDHNSLLSWLEQDRIWRRYAFIVSSRGKVLKRTDTGGPRLYRNRHRQRMRLTGRYLQLARERMSLTPQEMASRLGIGSRKLELLEGGDKTPLPPKLLNRLQRMINANESSQIFRRYKQGPVAEHRPQGQDSEARSAPLINNWRVVGRVRDSDQVHQWLAARPNIIYIGRLNQEGWLLLLFNPRPATLLKQRHIMQIQYYLPNRFMGDIDSDDGAFHLSKHGFYKINAWPTAFIVPHHTSFTVIGVEGGLNGTELRAVTKASNAW